MKGKRFLILIFILTSYFVANSQPATLYYMTNVEQSIYTNPARINDCCFNFSFLNLNLGIVSSSLNYNMLFSQDEKGNFYIDFDKIYQDLPNKNYIYQDLWMPILNFGFRIKRVYFHYDYSFRNDLYFSYPHDLFKFFAEGNKSGSVNFSDWSLKTNLFTQSSFIIGYQALRNLYVGFGVKFYKGYFNFDTKQFNLNITVDTTSNYPLTINASYNFQISSPIHIEVNDSNELVITNTLMNDTTLNVNSAINYFLKPTNSGIGLDFGIIYKPIKQLELSASLIDIGKIKWRANPTQAYAENVEIKFEGLDLVRMQKDTAYANKIIDSITKSFNPTLSYNVYKTSMARKLNLGVAFTPVHWATLGFNYRGIRLDKGVWLNTYHFALALNLGYGWNFTGSYTIYPHSTNNFGFGMALRLPGFQIYFLTDNLALPNFGLSYFTNKDIPYQENSATIWLKNTKVVNLMFGINLKFGCKDRVDYGLLTY